MNRLGKATNMKNKKLRKILLACAILVVSSAVEAGSEVAPGKNLVGAQKVSLNVTHVTASGFQISAFVETGSVADVCLVTYNTSNHPEDLAPIMCSATENHGRYGVLLSSYLSAPLPDDFVATLTVYQQDAKYYSSPVRCDLH